MSPSRRRQCIDHVRDRLGVSERRACRVLGQHRSAQRHIPRGRGDEDRLVADMIELARRYGRYGYRRIAALLRDADWQVNDKQKARDRVTPQLVVRELRTNGERIVESAAQQAIPAQSLKGGGIDLAKHVEALALAKLQIGESQECCLACVRKAPVPLARRTDESGPDLVHRVRVRQRRAGDLRANEQIHDDKPTEDLMGARIGAEAPQLRKCPNQLRDFLVGYRRDVELDDSPTEVLAEHVDYHLATLRSAHGDDLDAASLRGANHAPKHIFSTFGDRFRGVDHEDALGRAQFGQEH